LTYFSSFVEVNSALLFISILLKTLLLCLTELIVSSREENMDELSRVGFNAIHMPDTVALHSHLDIESSRCVDEYLPCYAPGCVRKRCVTP